MSHGVSSQTYDTWVYAAALAGLPLQTPRRLRQLIDAGDPCDVWSRVTSGNAVIARLDQNVVAAWATYGNRELEEMYRRCCANDMDVVVRGMASYPDVFLTDPAAPAVFFTRGDVSVLSQRRVGIIGTRHATRAGARMAFTLGAQLSSANVAVVSGLARGIDVQAHAGVFSLQDLAAPPVAVVASGVDVVYPPEHHSIWNRIATDGLVLSESPPGTEPAPHRFPLRNRIIASLSEVLVVVESGHKGGSMITVREAMKRDVTVMAVPGSPQLRQSEGTTALLRDGCAPVGDVTDILVALGLDTR
ncbi:MAG: processing protein DprA, partial [Actinomycetota bacterium]